MADLNGAGRRPATSSTSGPDESRSATQLREGIEHTRAELSGTLTELANRLDMKAQARAGAQRAAEAATGAVARARSAVPEPVQHALDRAGGTIGPLVGRAGRRVRPYRTHILTGLGLAAAALWLVRRRGSGS